MIPTQADIERAEQRGRELKHEYLYGTYTPPKEKACSKCGVVKPMSEYYRDRRLKDKRQAECKLCYRKRKGRA